MNTPEPSVNKPLSELLQEQLTTLNDIKDVIATELEAVKLRDGQALVSAASDKVPLLQKVSEIDLQISQHPELDSIKDKPQLVELQTKITSALEICQTQNEVVYLSAKQTELAVEKVKSIIVGGSKNTTYDAYGKKSSNAALTKGIKA
jgi:flagellar biosynthesis/type III secretory pathway chaperone